MSAPKPVIPNRQIRAVFDADTITVYQAYSEPIATAAVSSQQLDSSASFSHSRMTWIKPSWCWMLYRAGYSLKDERQARILALKITRAGFEEMLRGAELSHAPEKGHRVPGREMGESGLSGSTGLGKHVSRGSVRVQWDPERGPRLQRYQYRSVQIGVPRELVERFVKEWIVEIEDVTEKAMAVKDAVDSSPAVDRDTLIAKGLMPMEMPYPVPSDIAALLGMEAVE